MNEEATLNLIVKVSNKDKEISEALMSESAFNAEKFRGAGIDGGGDLLTIVMSLGSASLAAFITILRAHWNRAKYTKIEVDGIKLEGVSPKEIKDLLDTLIQHKQTTAASDKK